MLHLSPYSVSKRPKSSRMACVPQLCAMVLSWALFGMALNAVCKIVQLHDIRKLFVPILCLRFRPPRPFLVHTVVVSEELQHLR